MRYMLHLFSIALAFLFAPVAVIISAFVYQPTAREALVLDRIAAPVTVISIQRSRFRAFVDSARSHVDFTAGHFDPGRMAA